MSTREHTKLARVPLLLLDYAEQQDCDRVSLMRAAAITAQELEDPDARIAASTVVRLWKVVIEHLDQPGLGVQMGRTVTAKTLGLVGYAMYHSTNLHDAVQCLARYQRIISEAVRYDIVGDGSSTCMTYTAHPALSALRHPIEGALAALLNVTRELTGRDIVPQRLTLPFPRDESEEEFRRSFGIRPQFESHAAAVLFTDEQMRLPIEAADPTLHGYLTDLAETTLQALHTVDHDFEAQVRETLLRMMPLGKPDLWGTAAEMGMSARTLQRRLHQEGSSFSKVLDDFKRGLSADLLANKKLAVADVAFLLGYSEPSAFRRAFRRWHKTSPGDYKAG